MEGLELKEKDIARKYRNLFEEFDGQDNDNLDTIILALKDKNNHLSDQVN